MQHTGQLSALTRPRGHERLDRHNASAAAKGTTELLRVPACVRVCVQHASSHTMFSLECDPWFQFLSSS